MKFKKGDRVVNKLNHKLGTVVDVNDYWGWFIVEYDDGDIREYTSVIRDHELAVRLFVPIK